MSNIDQWADKLVKMIGKEIDGSFNDAIEVCAWFVEEYAKKCDHPPEKFCENYGCSNLREIAANLRELKQ